MKNLTKNIRHAKQERRNLNSTLSEAEIERRKRPDRRLSGLDVCVVDVNETAFNSFVGQLSPKK